jgi:hypothetical protein
MKTASIFAIVAILLLQTPLHADALDTSTYGNRDSAYSGYHSQITDLYRNIVDGAGPSYTVADEYTDYYGATRTISTTVTNRILRNGIDYPASALPIHIDKTVPLGQDFMLRPLLVSYADYANTAPFAQQANLARTAAYGGYDPKDCMSDPACSTVSWVNSISYAVHALTADYADTTLCPTGDVLNSEDPQVTGGAEILMLLALIWPDQKYWCMRDANNKRNYNATATDSAVTAALYMLPGGHYNNVLSTFQWTYAQRVKTSSTSQWLTTTDPFTGGPINAIIEGVQTSGDAGTVLNETINYVGGNTPAIIISQP